MGRNLQTKSFAKFEFELHRGLRSLESLGNIQLLAMDGFTYPAFSEEWVKRIHIPKRATKIGIVSKEHTSGTVTKLRIFYPKTEV